MMSDLPVSEPIVVPSSAEGNGVRNDVSVWVAARAGEAAAARGEAAAVLMERLRMGTTALLPRD